MPLHPNISYSSQEFRAIREKNIEYVKQNFYLYEPLKDYWLTVASCYSNLEINSFLISQGANPNFNDTENFTNAIFQNDLALVQLYVSHNCILIDNDNDHLGGAVMGAINNDNLDMLKYLIDLGCNIHLDNDYAFNRGIAENAIKCISYLTENFHMSFNPHIEYNIQKIITNNYYQILDYILTLVEKPFNFDFSNNLQTLFSKGHPEIFDVFVKHGFINEEIFIQYFESILYYFPNKINFFNHLKNNYSNWFNKAEQKNIDISKIKTLLDFVVSQKYSDSSSSQLDFSVLEIIINIPFIKKFIEQEPHFISEILLKNIEYKNNIELLEHSYESEYIQINNIQMILNELLPKIIDKSYFCDLLNIVFRESFTSSLPNLNKIYSYFKLGKSMNKKLKEKIKKI